MEERGRGRGREGCIVRQTTGTRVPCITCWNARGKTVQTFSEKWNSISRNEGNRRERGRVVAEETHRELPQGAKIRENHARISLVFRPL